MKKIIISLITLIICLLSTVTVVFAWFSYKINKQNINLNTGMLEMEAYLYKGNDWNLDGELDKEYVSDTVSYDIYTLIENEDNEFVVYESNLMPLDVLTYKIKVKNTGSINGLLSINIFNINGELSKVLVTDKTINGQSTALRLFDHEKIDICANFVINKNTEVAFIFVIRFAMLNELKALSPDFTNVNNLNAYQNANISFKFNITLIQDYN